MKKESAEFLLVLLNGLTQNVIGTQTRGAHLHLTAVKLNYDHLEAGF
jgi:hypothetical protein